MKKGDIIVLLMIGLFIIVSFFVVYFPNRGKDAYYVEIRVNGQLYDRLNLCKQDLNETIEIKQEDGSTNVIEISGKRVRVKQANCPDKVCVNTGWIQNPGETIVCLPNKVVVKIVGQPDNVDGISY